jgi:hypothetical protein
MFSDLLPITDVRWQRWHPQDFACSLRQICDAGSKKCGKANALIIGNPAEHLSLNAQSMPMRVVPENSIR